MIQSLHHSNDANICGKTFISIDALFERLSCMGQKPKLHDVQYFDDLPVEYSQVKYSLTISVELHHLLQSVTADHARIEGAKIAPHRYSRMHAFNKAKHPGAWEGIYRKGSKSTSSVENSVAQPTFHILGDMVWHNVHTYNSVAKTTATNRVYIILITTIKMPFCILFG